MVVPFQSILTALALLLALSVSFSHGDQDGDKMVKNLEEFFLTELKNPTEYRAKVDANCSVFADGSFAPYSMIAVGLCQRIYDKPNLRSKSRLPAIEAAIELLLDTKPKQELPDNQGAALSHQAMALAAYRLAGGKREDWKAYEAKLYPHLVKLLTEKKGLPIYSFPDKVRPLDTSVALFALTLRDRVSKTNVAPALVKAHLEWLNGDGADFETGLPCSAYFPKKNQAIGARGSDLSLRLALWTEIDPAMAKQWYSMYRVAFWHETKFLKGFCEWGHQREVEINAESGPIISGVGSTATVLGAGVTQALNDKPYNKIITEQASKLAKARKSNTPVAKIMTATVDKTLGKCGIPTDASYITGSLYGDILAFYSLSWHSFPKK